MYILVIALDAPNTPALRAFVGATREAVMRDDAAAIALQGCLAWRLHDGDGWCAGSDDAWKYIVTIPNQAYICQ